MSSYKENTKYSNNGLDERFIEEFKIPIDPLNIPSLSLVFKALDNYEQDHSHSHCWSSTTPPCGQRVEHLKCCICEKLNPKIESLK